MTTGVPETRNERLVVVGGGQAATQMIEVARQQGFEGPVTLLSEEPVPPYHDRHFQAILGRSACEEWLLYRPKRFYDKYAMNVVWAPARRKSTASGNGYAPGRNNAWLRQASAGNRRAGPRFPGPGADHEHVFYIRTLADVDGLRARLPEARTAVLSAAALSGLETAAVLVQMGIEVTLVAAQDPLLPKAVAGPVASFLRDQHLQHGVEIVLGAQVAALHGKSSGPGSRACRWRCAWAISSWSVSVPYRTSSSPKRQVWIVTTESLSTRWHDQRFSDLCRWRLHESSRPLLGRRLRLETVHNAVEQGRTAGTTIAGKDIPYVQSPWVWSDQYKLRLQCVGVSEGYDRTVLRGNVGASSFSLFYYSGDELLAVNCINQPRIFGAVRRLLNERIPPHGGRGGRSAL